MRYRYAAGAALCGLGCTWAALQSHAWPVFAIAVGFVFASFCLATEQQTHIENAVGTVTREGRLFGVILVWRTRRSLTDFCAVTFQRTHDPEGGDSVFVGLQPKRGRFVAVRYFATSSGGRCDAAVDYACRLAGNTSLQVIRENLA